MTRLVFAGAGSIQFAPMLLADVMNHERLGDVTLVMHDIDEARLDLTHRLALRMLPHARSNVTVEATLDPRAALTGADFVIVSIELDRFDTWDVDRDVPAHMGIPQALGENGGPGGLFHALRMIPGAVRIAQLVDEVASPSCVVLNLTNPLSRICQGILEHSDVTPIGLCHEIHGGRRMVSELLDVPREELRVEAAGLNHFTWFTKIEDAAGNDLYPRLAAMAPADYVDDHRLLTSDLFRATGLQCVTDDSHAGEYLRWGAHPRCAWTPGMRPNPFYRRYREHVAAIEARVRAVLADEVPLAEVLEQPSGEEVIGMVAAMARGERFETDALNVRNVPRGGDVGPFLPELPDWAVVEVPGHVDADGGHGCVVDGLPDWVRALCNVQVRIHKLTVRAAMEGDRKAAIEALLIDPSVPSIEHAEAVFDALLEAHRPYLPNWR